MCLALKRSPPTRHAVCVDESCRAFHIGNSLRLQIARVDFIQAQNVRIALSLEHAPIVLPNRHVETVVGGVRQTERDARRVPHHLFRHAAHVHAGTAQALRFDDGDLCAVLGRPLSTRQTAAAARQCR